MRITRAVSLLLGGLMLAGVKAETIRLPANSDNVVGTLGLTSTEKGDVLVDMGLAYSQGYVEMKLANPKVDPWLPGVDTEVVIPSQYVLPDSPREGIVINLAEMRLYYYPRPKRGEPPVVLTFPISVGRQDWKTPLGLTRVVKKDVDPNWYPPESIRAEHAADGDPLPKVVPAGPDNPLGRYALRLGHNGYLIHGTNKPYGIGMRVTHGCLRLYPKDIERLFHEVAVGTPVRIVNQPFKLGRLNGRLFLEVHPPFEEDGDVYRDRFTEVVGQITRMAPEVDWDHLQSVVAEHKGIPEPLVRRRAERPSRSGRDL
ncbi:MAG: L,D-transpeptidase family protein [Gammaproteobacteria bacterium]